MTNKLSQSTNYLSQITARKVLILLASLANTSLWVMAGILAEGDGWLAVFSAGCLGLALSGGLVVIAEKWAAMSDEVQRRIPLSKPAEYEMIANNRKQIAAASFAVVLSVESLMLAPVIIALEGEYRLSEVLHPVILWAWAIGRPLVAVLVMAGLAVVNDEHAAPVRQTTPAPAQVAPQSTKPVPAQSAPTAIKCALCGVEYAAKGGKGGHYKKHHPKSAP